MAMTSFSIDIEKLLLKFIGFWSNFKLMLE